MFSSIKEMQQCVFAPITTDRTGNMGQEYISIASFVVVAHVNIYVYK